MAANENVSAVRLMVEEDVAFQNIRVSTAILMVEEDIAAQNIRVSASRIMVEFITGVYNLDYSATLGGVALSASATVVGGSPEMPNAKKNTVPQHWLGQQF